MTLMDLVGMPIRDALPRIVDLRDRHGLQDRIRIIASAKLINPATWPGRSVQAPIS